jgi:hypothetical protein
MRSIPVARPQQRGAARLHGPGEDAHLVRDDETREQADAELPDEVPALGQIPAF